MSLSTTFSDINSLGQISFIAGSNYTLKFTVLNQSGSPVDLGGATCVWRCAPFGTDHTQIQKTGSVLSTNVFAVYLGATDTANLSGKFSHQPIITFSSGSTYIPAQGILTIIKGLPSI